MDGFAVIQSIVALVFVLALIMLVSHLLKKYGNDKFLTPRKSTGHKRLSVVESIIVDGKRRLVIVRRDDVEHLLLLSPTAETVVETGIILKDEHDIAAKTWKMED